MKALKSKFKVGEIVAYQDEFSFNPANAVITVGKIIAIHFYQGHELWYAPHLGETEPKSLKGKITYTVSGLSIIPNEKDLIEWKES